MPDVGGLSGHVGAGQDHHFGAVVGQLHVIGHVGPGVQDPLHHRMTAVSNPDGVSQVQLGPDIAVLHRCVRQPGEHVQLCDGRGDLANGARRFGQLGADPMVNGPFSFFQTISGVQHQRFVFLQFWNDIAFGVGQRLTPDVVLGHLIDVGLADLDVVAEDLVVTHFQAFDLGAVTLPLFESSYELAGIGRGAFQFVHLRRKSWPDHVAVAHRARRFRRDGLFDQRANLWQWKQLALEPLQVSAVH